eukprot:5659217-Prymnesium_polylepis.1
MLASTTLWVILPCEDRTRASSWRWCAAGAISGEGHLKLIPRAPAQRRPGGSLVVRRAGRAQHERQRACGVHDWVTSFRPFPVTYSHLSPRVFPAVVHYRTRRMA